MTGHGVAKLILSNSSLKRPCLQECGEKLCCFEQELFHISSVLGWSLSCSNRLTPVFGSVDALSTKVGWNTRIETGIFSYQKLLKVLVCIWLNRIIC